ncbi:hypothetical protein [Paenibacillus andongensis]|uniref:RNA polymerase factor sigma-54 n=1 Tax=Paenibacillus andongensis TaxID=2975482 RepID=UPI0034635C22
MSTETLRHTLAYIRSLNPRPGLAFEQKAPHYIKPDAVIRKEHGDFVLMMMDAYLPKVVVNEEYSNTAPIYLRI